MKKNGRRKWKRPWDKKLLLQMPKQPKLTRASAKMLCRHPLQQTMCYWRISQKVSKQQQCRDSDITCNLIYAGYPACFQLPFARLDWFAWFHQPFEHFQQLCWHSIHGVPIFLKCIFALADDMDYAQDGAI